MYKYKIYMYVYAYLQNVFKYSFFFIQNLICFMYRITYVVVQIITEYLKDS